MENIPFGLKSEIRQSLIQVDFTPSAAVTGGDVVTQNDLVGLAMSDIAAGELGALSVAGVALMSKGAEDIPAGTKVYWDESAANITTSGSGNISVGHVVEGIGTSGSAAMVLYGIAR